MTATALAYRCHDDQGRVVARLERVPRPRAADLQGNTALGCALAMKADAATALLRSAGAESFGGKDELARVG